MKYEKNQNICRDKHLFIDDYKRYRFPRDMITDLRVFICLDAQTLGGNDITIIIVINKIIVTDILITELQYLKYILHWNNSE